MIKLFRNFIFIIILFQSFVAYAEIPEKVYIYFRGSSLELNTEPKEPEVVNIKTKDFVLAESDNGWIAKKIDEDTYHLKCGDSNKAFWEIDAKRNFRFYFEEEGEFGVRQVHNDFNGSRIKIVGSRIYMGAPFARIEVDTKKEKANFYWGDMDALHEDYFEVKKLDNNVYHIRGKGLGKEFFKLDADLKEIWLIKNGTFGKEGGDEEFLRLYVGYARLLDFLELDEATNKAALKREPNIIKRVASLARQKSGGNNKVYLNFKSSSLSFETKSEEEKTRLLKRDMSEWEKERALNPSNVNLLFDERSLTSGFALVPGDTITISEADPGTFHLKFSHWGDFFWKVDTKAKKVFEVKKGSFSLSKEVENEIPEIKVEEIKARGLLVNYTGSEGKTYQLSPLDSYAEFDRTDNRLNVYWGKTMILDSDYFEVRQQAKDSYKITSPGDSDQAYRLDLESGQLYGKYLEGKEFQTHTYVSDDIKKESDKFAGKGIWEDLGYWKLKPERPESPWIEAQKKLYSDLLKRESYDVLVVPFQVQGYAIDRIGRSLMTRYLTERIESGSGLKVADPGIVAKALGERNRAFSLEDINRLANELKVKTLILGYVGHDLDKKMRLTLEIKEKEKLYPFDYDSPVRMLDWRNMAFTDENLPSDVFKHMLDEVTAKLPFKLSKAEAPKKYKGLKKVSFPPAVSGIFEGGSKNPVKDIYYLQFLGMLFPENTPVKEAVFERSIVALDEISKKSPDFNLLRARAMFYLYRRPAAVAALGKPKTAAEKAFAALLNGNLPELKKWTQKIDSPLHRLISIIELNDLMRRYTEVALTENQIGDLTKDTPEWALLIYRRLKATDSWFSQSNLLVKAEMDKALPVEGYTAEGIAKSRAVKGESPFEGDDVDFSPYRHYAKILSEHPENYCCSNISLYPQASDYLDLLYEISESNLLQNARIRVFNQSLPKRAIEVLDRYEAIYAGHPEMAYLRAEALREMSDEKSGVAGENLLKSSSKYAYNAYYWLQGQTKTLRGRIRGNEEYSSDFPGRASWFSNAEDALRYSHTEFSYLKTIIKKLKAAGKMKEMDRVVKENKDRFIGHPAKTQYFAELEFSKGNVDKALKLYKEAITINPEAWDNYINLGELMISENRPREAKELFLSYPPFNYKNAEGHVELSNNAAQAGYRLLRIGEIEEAKPLLELSASYYTGSYSCLESQTLLAMFEGNYIEAADTYLRRFNRYKDEDDLLTYFNFLHTFDRGEEAWAIYETLDVEKYMPDLWRSLLIALRKEGKTDNEILAWIKDSRRMPENIKKGNLPSELLVEINFLDRSVNDESIESSMSKSATPSESMKAFFKAIEFYEENDSKRSFETLKKAGNLNDRWQMRYFALPYFAMIAAKSGHEEVLPELFKKADEYKVSQSDIMLAKAYVEGVKGNHKEAIKLLMKAKNNMRRMHSGVLPPWYLLVDAAERLYKDSGLEDYRSLAVEWAKVNQKIWPIDAWAYAIEAKYTDSEMDRKRALGMTLYLDRHSAHISHFSEAEKKEAKTWMEKNNPFHILNEPENDNLIKTEI